MEARYLVNKLWTICSGWSYLYQALECTLCDGDFFFGDLKEEDPEEYDKRIHTYFEKRNELNKQMKDCLTGIMHIRQCRECGWDEQWEGMYAIYEKSKDYDHVNFHSYCENYLEYHEYQMDAFTDIRKQGSDAWHIAILSARYVKLRFEYKKVVDEMETFLMYNSFE